MSWSKDALKNINALKEKNDRIFRSAFLRLAAQVDLVSPVDTGRFRSNWVGAYGSADTSTFDYERDSVGLALEVADTVNVSNVFYYTNSLPYAKRLEFGWSEQAPSGIVRITARNWPQYVQEAIRNDR